MADNTGNKKNAANMAREAVKTVAGATKAVAKGVSGDLAGAGKEAIKIAPQLIKIFLIFLLITSIMVGTFLQAPSLIWANISKKYSDWTLVKAVEAIDNAMDNSAANTCDNALKNFDYYINDFEGLRNQFYADGQDGISVMMMENGDSFCIAIDKTGNDVLIDYYNAKSNDFTEFRYKNGNNFYNDPVNVSYSEIINAYVYLKQKQNDTNTYEYTYDSNGKITGTKISDKDDALWKNGTKGNMNDSAYIWGITDTVGLYRYISEKANQNKMFNIKYKLGTGDEEYEKINNKKSKELANNPKLAKEKGYDHYYQIEINVSTYQDEKVTLTNKNISYSKFTQELFDLSDDEMVSIAENTYISDGIIDAATKSDTNSNIPNNFSEYFILSPAKKIFDNLLNGKSVLQQMTDKGLIMDNLTVATCRNLISAKALSAHNSKLAVTYENWLGIRDDDTFTKYFGDSVKKAKVGDSGLFATYVFYSTLSNKTLTLRDSLFKTTNDSIIYKSEDYAKYFRNHDSYYSGKNIDLSSKTKIEQGDLLFFGVNYHTEITTDVNGNQLPVPSITNNMEDNVQVGIVTSVSGSKISVVVYNWLENREINTNTQGISQIFDWGLDSLKGDTSYVTSLITIDISDKNDPYIKYVSGYGKPDYSNFVKEYNKTYAKEIENLQNSSHVINTENGSGTLGYPTSYRTISAGYPNYSDGSYHGGVDWPCPTGTSVYAAESGTVITARELETSYGHYIVIDHGNGLQTLYAHNSQLLVKAGDKVARGQLIAKSGSTGNSTGPHCHFEVRVNGKRVNPMAYLKE